LILALVQQGRDREAIHTLAYYHADGDEEDPLVRFEYEEIKTAIDFDRACEYTELLICMGKSPY
jgi:hypothetical protein